MALSMYMGQPLTGQKPNIAIDLYDRSLKNLAPSYLTAKLNDKIMNGLTSKSGTTYVSDNGNTITTEYDDGTKETLVISENGTVFTSYVYSKDGIVLKKMVTTVDIRSGKIRNDVTYDGSVNGIVDFATASWEEIAVMLTRHYSGTINLADFWSVGDTKTVDIAAMDALEVDESHEPNSQKIVILGFDHDTISGGSKSAITIGLLNGLGNPGFINHSNTNAGGWSASNRRAWCNTVFYNALPAGLRSLIKPVDKRYSVGNSSSIIGTCVDKCFLLSESELIGELNSLSFPGEGIQYPFFEAPGTLKKKQSDTISGYDNWLTRSTYKNNGTQFIYVEGDGSLDVCDANSSYQIIPAFCI